MKLIEYFNSGQLPLLEGTTLRAFLSKLLDCDPMRISKKFQGNQALGKVVSLSGCMYLWDAHLGDSPAPCRGSRKFSSEWSRLSSK